MVNLDSDFVPHRNLILLLRYIFWCGIFVFVIGF